MDENLVGEPAEVDSQPRRQRHRHADPRHLGQPADDRLLARSLDPFLVSRHVTPLAFVRFDCLSMTQVAFREIAATTSRHGQGASHPSRLTKEDAPGGSLMATLTEKQRDKLSAR